MSDRSPRRRAPIPGEIRFPDELPISAHHGELVEAISNNQVVIVAGETGSGKSTQLPKLCLELGRGIDGWIGHTQPRRIAARSIAERVAEELGVPVGEQVGYAVRFSDRTSDRTLVKVMTDGILLAEIQRDRRLSRYDTLIVDEAHERSLNIDFLLGYLHRLLPRRPDLKLIITSATIDTERFARHFGDAPVVEVSGRGHPVEVRYRPLEDPSSSEPRDQPQAICDAIEELWRDAGGDILVFCSGEREIRDAADAIEEMSLAHTEVVPLYARLSAAEQHRVFEPHRGRRVVLATNVAETSLTVPGIRFVIDTGTARISRYSRRTKVQQLPIEPISRASADQRAGRCGRVGPGVCIRLYDEADFEARPEFTEPEILRTNLASVILQMAALGLGEVESFPFIDPPDRRAVRDGVLLLEELGALAAEGRGGRHRLTAVGRSLARLPLDPRLGRMVIEADRSACLSEVLVIAAALSIQDPRERPKEARAHADQMHARFRHPGSDLLEWPALWEYLRSERRGRTSSGFRRMCRDEFLNYRRVREWQDIHTQLREVVHELGFHRNRRPASDEVVHRALLSGLLSQIGVKEPDGHEYRGARGARFAISPGSRLFKKGPRWVMAAELVETSRLWARGVASIEPEWVEAVGAHLVHKTHSDPWWDAEGGSAVANETVTIFGLPLVEGRTVRYGRIDPAAARLLFIRHALVDGEWAGHHAFVERNRLRFAEAAELEARLRRVDLMADDDALVDFFDARVPADVVSVRHFDRWWKTASVETPDLLDLRLEDVLAATPDPDELAAFPEEWHHGDVSMPLRYEFDPGGPTDGFTVDVPVGGLERLDPDVFDWLVPGLRLELVTELMRTLPKRYRKRLVPVPDTAAEIVEALGPDGGGLVESLRVEISRRLGEAVPVDALDPSRLPAHLRPRFRVVDETGRTLEEGPDLAALKSNLVDVARRQTTGAASEFEQTGITTWSIGTLAPRMEVSGPDHTVVAYPSLVDEGDSVSVRLLATEDEQRTAMWEGTRRLLLLSMGEAARPIRALLADDTRRVVRTVYGDVAEWVDDCVDAALDEVLIQEGGPVRDGVAFDRLRSAAVTAYPEQAHRVGTASLAVLTGHDVLSRRLRALPVRWADVADDVGRQMRRLIHPGFVGGLGADRLADVLRYLQAIEYRLDRLELDPARDREVMSRILPLEARHDELVATLPGSQALLDAAWMLQELRVSLFAQPIGTRGSVSEKRVRRALDRVLSGG